MTDEKARLIAEGEDTIALLERRIAIAERDFRPTPDATYLRISSDTIAGYKLELKAAQEQLRRLRADLPDADSCPA